MGNTSAPLCLRTSNSDVIFRGGLEALSSSITLGRLCRPSEPPPSPSPVKCESIWLMRGHLRSLAEPGNRPTTAGTRHQSLQAAPAYGPPPQPLPLCPQAVAPLPCAPPPATFKSKSEVKDFYCSTDTSEKKSK